ncbi:helix-turn-helix domain-containing protein [Streptomyces canus]|uniref:helix-turn-helix domain-containing protein n=1 Tax=Streptomyces canus TaxID=58343 RepID=UPI00386FD170
MLKEAAGGTSSILSTAFELLNALNYRDRVTTLAELSRAIRLEKSTVHRPLRRLMELGAIESVPVARLGRGLVFPERIGRRAGARRHGPPLRDRCRLPMPYSRALGRRSKNSPAGPRM